MGKPVLNCPLCSCQAFDNVEALQSSLLLVATKQLACPICQDIIFGLDKFTIHLFNHKTFGPLLPHHQHQSKVVEASCSTAGQDDVEVKLSRKGRKEPDHPWRCNYCESPPFLLNQAVTSDLYLPCPHCEAQFSCARYLDLHAAVAHPADNCGLKAGDIRCRLCQQVTVENMKELHQHLAVHHQDRLFLCHLCLKVFKTRGSLHLHVRVAHKTTADEMSGKRLMKKISGPKVDSDDLNKAPACEDVVSHEEHPCATCKKVFKKDQHLIQHLKTHEGKQWECDVCNKFFTTKYFLKKHKRLHTGETPYCCEICGRTFTFQQSYHKHMLYHSDDRPHVCSDCGKAFKELSTLQNHQRIHTGEKPFACETCGKSFRQRVSYLVHRRIHTGAMPYKCTACGKAFRYKVSQQTHKCDSTNPGTVVKNASEFVQRLLETVQRHSEGPAKENSECSGKELSSPNEEAIHHTPTHQLPVDTQDPMLLMYNLPSLPEDKPPPPPPPPWEAITVNWPNNTPLERSVDEATQLQNLSLSSPPKPSSPNSKEFDDLLTECSSNSWVALAPHNNELAPPLLKSNPSATIPNLRSLDIHDQAFHELFFKDTAQNSVQANSTVELETINQESIKDLLLYVPNSSL